MIKNKNYDDANPSIEIVENSSKNSHLEIWLTSKEAAKILKVTTRTLVTWRNQGDLPFSNPGGRMVRYRAQDLHNFLMACYYKPKCWKEIDNE